MEVTFNVSATLGEGDELCIVGNPFNLGSWNTARALRLLCGDDKVWRVCFRLEEDDSFEYKYIVKRKNASIQWEDGDNRHFSVLLEKRKGCCVISEEKFNQVHYREIRDRVFSGRLTEDQLAQLFRDGFIGVDKFTCMQDARSIRATLAPLFDQNDHDVDLGEISTARGEGARIPLISDVVEKCPNLKQTDFFSPR